MLSKSDIAKLLAVGTNMQEAPHCCPEARQQSRPCVRIEAIAKLPSKYGQFQVVAFRNDIDDKEHVAFIRGNILNKQHVPVRIHSECLTGDAAYSMRCDCHDQLVSALRRIGRMPRGVLVYLRQEGRGIGLINKIKAYMLQDDGMDTFEANRALGFKNDERNFSIAAHILRALHIQSVHLMTNNPEKIKHLEEQGITVSKRIPLSIKPTRHNKFYLKTKKKQGGHLL